MAAVIFVLRNISAISSLTTLIYPIGLFPELWRINMDYKGLDETEIVQYLALGFVATVLFIGVLLIVAIDGMN